MNPIVKRESPLRPELILNISCGEPVRALDLGGLLTVISRDYRNFSVGEDLVITWVAEGSLLIGLATKAALTNHVITFAKHIRDLLKGLLGGSAALFAKQKSGTKTVENLLKLAVSSKSQVDVQYVAPDGERLSITVKPKQARAALGVLQQTKKSTAQRIPASRDAFLRIAQTGDSAALEKIIEALVDRRDRELLQTLLEVSDRQRLYTVAEKLREAIKRIDGSGNEQPLLTSS